MWDLLQVVFMFPLETLLGHQSKLRRHEWSSFFNSVQLKNKYIPSVTIKTISSCFPETERVTKQQRREKLPLTGRNLDQNKLGRHCVSTLTPCQCWYWYLSCFYHTRGVQSSESLHFLNEYPSIRTLHHMILGIWSDPGGITGQYFCLLSLLEENFMRSSTITTETL